MKIVNKIEFFKLPVGTVYNKINKYQQPDGMIYTKGYQFENDWAEVCLTEWEAQDSGERMGRLDDMMGNGASYPLDICGGRDGLFEDTFFLIYEKDDVKALIEHLQYCMEAYNE